MPGPTPKHPSVRSSRRPSQRGFTSLVGGREGDAPSWPLPSDAALVNKLDYMQDRVASLAADLEACEDGRKRGGLKRQLGNAEAEAALLKIQVEQQSDLELEQWGQLWSTPQAKLWEDSAAFVRSLAQFVRWNVKGEQGDIEAAREARIRGKEFGLTPLTLMGLRAEIERADEAQDRGERRRSRTVPPKSKSKSDPRGGLYAV